MNRLRAWLRPPRSLLILFLCIVGIPAATLIALGLQLIEQDRALARQRKTELLQSLGNRGVKQLRQDLAGWTQRLATLGCTQLTIPDDVVCLTVRGKAIEAFPRARIRHYPVTRLFAATPAIAFTEIDSLEFRSPPEWERALAAARPLARSGNATLRAGALLRQARILRKLGRPDEALSAFSALSQIPSVSIELIDEPADLFARRTRCAMLAELSRTEELHREAAALADDLRAGRWQLDKDVHGDIARKLEGWLGSALVEDDHAEAFSRALEWLSEKSGTPAGPASNTSIEVRDFGGMPLTVFWLLDSRGLSALVFGPRFVESHWAPLARAQAAPAFLSIEHGNGTPMDGTSVLLRPMDTELPWTLVVTNGDLPLEPPEFTGRRRNLLGVLAAIVVLAAAGSYFAWRAVTRELAAARLQTDFVSAVSHEFRTPLTTLRQFNELLADTDGPDRSERLTFYGAQSRATDRLSRLVESLLDFGRMEAGRHPYTFEAVDAARLAQDVSDEFAREHKGAWIVCTSDGGAHFVSVDREAMSRALWNLLDNARKYSGDGPRKAIELRVAHESGRVSITVRDHGVGIPQADRHKLFQKFVRGTAAKASGIKGTGLGLAMVREIVEAHNGTVGLESTEGVGSAFTLRLPAARGATTI